MPALKFAYSTNAYTEFPLSYAILDVKRCGFDGVEVLADVPHADPLKIAPERVRKLVKLIDQLGLGISNVNANTNMALDKRNGDGFSPSLVDRKKSDRELRMKFLRAAVDLSRELGAKNMAISTGRMEPGDNRDEAMRRLEDALNRLLDYAEPRGVRLGIEYEPGLLVHDCGTLEETLERVPHPFLGANLDIGHATCAGEDVPTTIRRLAKRIWNVHFEDIRDRVHQHLVAGEGDIDFAAILRTIRQINYRGYITLELYPYKDRPAWAGKTSLERLKKIADVNIS